MRDFIRILAALPLVEWRRRQLSLHYAVALARAEGSRRETRTAKNRSRLRKAISRVDARLPGGGNCVRRALLEMSLDPAAARERLFAGLRTGGGPGSGHAWLESEKPAVVYDAVISV
jgi:hypothetical protein